MTKSQSVDGMADKAEIAPKMKLSAPKLFLLLLVVAIVFRLLFFVYALWRLPFSTDEAWAPLIGLHMLRGEFPVVWWGQNYMGTQGAFVEAILICVFGPHVATVRIYSLLVSILFLIVTYWLARKTCDETTALIALALLAVSAPYLTMCGALIPPPEYLSLVTMGSLSLALLVDLVYGSKTERRVGRFVLLGFLLGFAFWLHILVVGYVGVALLFLFLRDKLLVLRREFWAGVAAFVAGSFPLLWFNLTHHFATFRDVGQTADWHRSLALLQAAFTTTLRFLIGAKVMLYADTPHCVDLPLMASATLGAIWVAVIALVLLLRFRQLARLLLLSIKGSDGTAILVVMAAASLYVFCRGARSGAANVRYLLPIFSVLPVLLAYGLSRIMRWSRPLFLLLLFIVLGCQAWGDILLAKAWNDPRTVSEKLELPDTSALLRFLDEKGIRHAYAHFWISYRLTFEAKETLICSEPYNKRFPGMPVKFIDEVRTATNVAFIQHPKLRFVDDFDAMLRTDGGSYSKATVDVFTVYYDFRQPATASTATSGPLREIPRTEWRATASHGQPDVALMLDGNPRTRWATHQPQAPGMWIQVELDRTQWVGRIDMHMGTWASDFPRGFVVRVSEDGRDWQTVERQADVAGSLYWEAGHPNIYAGGEVLTADFPSRAVRYMRIELVRAHPVLDWSIAELRIFGPSS